MAEYEGIEYLRRKLGSKRTWVNTRYRYYEMKNAVKDNSSMIPPNMRWISACLGWCGKSVDSLADRLVFKEFANDNFDLNRIFQMNNPDTLFDSAILSALISSCCFIYISPDVTGYPRLQVIDGANATGIIDPITGLLKEGYAVIERDRNQNVVTEAYFTAGRTDYIIKGHRETETYFNNAPYPLLVPIIHRPDAVREFGHSRISRAQMKLVQSALKTLKRSEVSAEFYSFPQKYVLGVERDAEKMDKWQATMSSFLSFSKYDDGDRPTIGLFTQQLLSKIQSSLEYDIGNSKKLKELAAKIDKGMATYDELNDYAYELGGMLSKAYDTNLSSDVLPDGRMDYDIADNIITPTFTNNYDMAADAAVDV